MGIPAVACAARRDLRGSSRQDANHGVAVAAWRPVVSPRRSMACRRSVGPWRAATLAPAQTAGAGQSVKAAWCPHLTCRILAGLPWAHRRICAAPAVRWPREICRVAARDPIILQRGRLVPVHMAAGRHAARPRHPAGATAVVPGGGSRTTGRSRPARRVCSANGSCAPPPPPRRRRPILSSASPA